MSMAQSSWRLVAALGIAFAAACSTGVPASNPFDPEAPAEVQRKARLEGFVRFDTGVTARDIEVVATEAASAGAAAVAYPASTNDDGAFALELPPGVYNIAVEPPGFIPVFVNNVELVPGEARSLGMLTLVTGRGSLKGRVLALAGTAADAESESAVGAVVSLIPLDVPGGQAVTRVVDSNGNYFAEGLPAGHYVVRAEKDDFAPAYTSSALPILSAAIDDPAVEVSLDEQTTAPELKLYPASAILKVTDTSGVQQRFTNNRSIVIELYAFVEFLTEMRVAESEVELEEAAYEPFNSTRPWTLSDADGLVTLHAQFMDAYGVASDVFTTTIVLDRSPPDVTALTLNGGAPFLTNDDGTAAVTLSGQDLLSGVAALRYTAAPSFTSEAFELVDSTGVAYVRTFTYPLGTADGPKALRVQLRDRAGNVSVEQTASIYRDKTPPRPGAPVLEITAPLNAGGASVRSLVVTLELDVAPDRAGEPLFMALSNDPGLSASSSFVAYSSPVFHTLAPGTDALSRTIYALFKDGAGNLTQGYSIPVVVDRSGRITGSVALEDTADFSQSTISVWRRDGGGVYQDLGLAVPSGSTGAFTITGLDPGTYRLVLTHAGYVSRSLEGLSLSEGGQLVLPEVMLALARGDLSGRVTLQGEASHEGILVEAAPGVITFTDASGDFFFMDLPAGDYLVSAEKGSAYVRRNATGLAAVTQGGLTLVPAFVLEPVPGSIGGIVLRSGVTVQSGTQVVVSGVTVGGTEASDSAPTDDDGNYSVAPLTAGTYAVTFTAPGYRTVTQTGLVVSPGEDLSLATVQLNPATGGVLGVVSLVGRTDHSGVRVSLAQAGNEKAFTYTDAGGDYSFAAVSAGDYTATFSLTGFGTKRLSSVIVVADQVTTPAAQTLAAQVGDVSLKDIGEHTRLTSVQVIGEYPDAAAARFCERPGVVDPTIFSLAECPYQALTYVGGLPTFDPVTVPFAATPCPDPGDAVAICDGGKTVWVRIRDTGNVESNWFEVPVVLDRLPPVGHVVIAPNEQTLAGTTVTNGGAEYTAAASVRVVIVAREDDSGVRAGDEVSGVVSARLFRTPSDGAPVLVAMGEGIEELQGVALSGATDPDGARDLILELRDAAGNLSVLDSAVARAAVACPDPRAPHLPGDCDAIFLDQQAPVTLKLSINPLDVGGDYALGATYTTSPLVQLAIDSTMSGLEEDEAIEALISNDVNFTSAVVQPLPAPRTIISWALPPGESTKTVYVKVRDRARNQSGVFQDTIIVDTVSPETPVVNPVAAYTADATPTFSWGAVADADRYRLQLSDVSSFDGSGAVDVEQALAGTSFTATTLADARYYMRVRAEDDAGHLSSFSSAVTFLVDTARPAAPELQSVASPTSNNRPVFAWSSISDALGYELQIDSSVAFNTGGLVNRATAVTSLTSPVLADNTWYTRVRALDAAGNASDWSSVVSFAVDTTPPGNANPVAPAASAVLTSASVTLSWDVVAGAASYVLQVSPSAAMTAFEEYRLTGTQKSHTLPDGTWTFRVGTLDTASNASDVSTALKRTFTVDTQAPSVPTLVQQPALISTRTPTFVWSNESASGAVSYRLRVDAQTYVVGGTSHTPTDSLVDGGHSWTVAAVDSAGNVSAYAPTQSFDVDATAPAAPVLTPVAPDPTPQASPTFAFSGVAGAVSYQVEYDTSSSFSTGGADYRSKVVVTTSTQPDSPLGVQGTWYWRVTAIDAAGNRTASPPVDSFVLDSVAPADPTFSAPASAAKLATNSVTVTWSAPAGATSYRLDVATDASFTSPTSEPGLTSTSKVVYLGDGLFYVRVVAFDAAMNPSPGSVSRSFSVDTTAPDTPNPSLVATPTNDNTPTFSWSDTSASGAVGYRVKIDGTTTSVGVLNYTPGSALTDGNHTFAVAAIDDAGNLSDYSVAQAFSVDATAPTAPTLTAVSPDPTNGSSQSYTWTAVLDAVTYNVEWDTTSSFNSGSKGTATVATNSASVSSLAAGTWYWRVRANDSAANSGAWSSFDSYVIDVTAPANPALTLPADTAWATSSTVSFSWGTVADAAVYHFDLSQSPTLATYERTSLSSASRAASLPDGTWYWRVLAQDAAGNLSNAGAAVIRQVRVDTVAPGVPVLTAHASPTSDNTPSLAWGAVSGASDYVVVVNGGAVTTALLTHTPSALADGTHTWTVAARDAAGNQSANAPAQSIAVDATPPAVPTLTAYTPDPTGDNTPTALWSSVASAVSYTVRWDTAATFNSGNLGSATTSQTTHDLGPLANGAWYWCVLATDAVGNSSACAAADTFVVDTTAPSAPGLTAPANNSTSVVSDVPFSWGTAAGATSYRLQVGSDPALATIDFDVNGITGLARTVTLNDDVYYWRVLSTDSAGNQTPPSDGSVLIYKVTVDANAPGKPTLVAVPTPTRDATPTFAWSDESASGAVSYDLVIDATTTSVSDVTYTPSSNLSEGSHTVRVTSKDAAGNASASSATQTFFVDVTNPSGISGLSPANDAALVSSTVALSWGEATDASSLTYTLQVARGNDFTSLVLDTVLTGAGTIGTSVVLGDAVYYWRVRATDAAGNVSSWVPNASGRTFVVDTTAPDVPVLVATASLLNASPTLQWSDESASGAVNYRIQIDDSAAFDSTLVNTLTGGPTQYATSLADGTWYWRVRSVDERTPTNVSAYSSAGSFVLDTTAPGAPTSPAPAAGLATKVPLIAFSWVAPAGGAASYRLEIAYDSSFTAIAQQVTTVATSVSLSFPDGTYYWRVFSVDSAGNPSATAAAGTAFTVDTQAPRRPVAETSPTWVNAAQATYDIGWSDESDSGATGYEFQVSASSTFATTIDGASLTVTSTTRTRPAGSGTYYWRARAVDAVGNNSGWSVVQSFGVDTTAPAAFTLVAPATSTYDTDGSVPFSWNAATDANAVTYRLQVSLVSDFSNQVVVDTTLASLASTQSLANSLYYWRVTASDAAGNNRVSSSSPFSVTVDTLPPDAPSFSSFAAVTNDNTPNFAWTPVSGATSYRVLIDEDTTFATPVKTITVAGTSLVNGDYASALSPDGTYYAQVSASDAAGNRSAASATLSFTLDTAAPSATTACAFAPLATYGAPQPTYDEGAIATATPTLTWNAVTGASSFELQVQQYTTSWAVDATVSSIATNGVFAVSYALPSALALDDAGLYWFRVRAFDAAGNASGYRDCTVTAAGRIYARSDQTVPSVVTGLSITTSNPTSGSTLAFQWTKAQDTTHRGEMGYTTRLLAADGVTVLQSHSVAWSSPYSAGTRTDSFTGLAHGTYYVSVVAYDAALNYGAAATSSAFVVDRIAPDAPVLYSPLRLGVTGAVQRLGTLTPTFTWGSTASSGTTSYTLNIYNSDAAASRLTLARTVASIAETTHTLAVALTNGSYYRWEVVPVDSAGNAGTAGSTGPNTEIGWIQLDNGTPSAVATLSYPANAAQLNTNALYFYFTPSVSTDATTYTLEVYDSANSLYFTKSCAMVAGTNCYVYGGTAYVFLSGALFAPGTYSWRVRVADDVGNASLWTPNSGAPTGRTFIIDNTLPDAPTLASPTNNSFTKFTNPSFSWVPTDDSGATAYWLYLQVLSGSTWSYVSGYSPKAISGGTTSSTTSSGLTAGSYRWWMYAQDGANNWSPATTMSYFTADFASPNPPTLLSVDARNRSARLFWTAATDSPTNGSGISGYRVYYGETTNPSTYVDVANVTEYLLTGLSNKRDYFFSVVSIDGAGNLSVRSSEMNAPVGWVRTGIAVNSLYPVRPLGVAVRDRNVYVTYTEVDSVGNFPTGTLKVAVSNDGGDTWATRSLDNTQTWKRQSAPVRITDSGVVVATVGSDWSGEPVDWPGNSEAGYGEVRTYFSADNGTTWLTTYSTGTTDYWAHGSDVGLAANGDRVMAFFQDYSATAEDAIQHIYSTNGGANAYHYTSDYYNVANTSTTNYDLFKACSANMYTYVAWREDPDSGSSYLRTIAHHFLNDNQFTNTTDGTYATAVSSTYNPDDFDIACANHSKAPRAYIFSGLGNSIYRTTANSGGESWTTTSTPVVTDRGTSQRIVAWAGGENVYFVYRNLQGYLKLGESTNLGVTWTFSELDASGRAGYYPVISGEGTNDVVVAFTDLEGTTISFMRPAVKAARVRPQPADNTLNMSWDTINGIGRYRIDRDTVGVAPWDSAGYTTMTSYSPSTPLAPDFYQVVAIDSNGQAGNEGEVWGLSAFEDKDVIASAGFYYTPTSSTADVVAYRSGGINNVAVLPPYGTYQTSVGTNDVWDVIYYYSTDGAATAFTKYNYAVGASDFAYNRAMAGNSNHLALAYIFYEAATTSYYLRAIHASTINGTPTAATASASVNLATGMASGDLVAIGTAADGGNRAMIAYADVSADNIGFLWSTDYGATYTLRSEITIPNAANDTIGAITVGAIESNTVMVLWRQNEVVDASPANYWYYRIYFVTSTDGGATWSTPYQLRYGYLYSFSGTRSIYPYVADSTNIVSFGNDAYTVVAHGTYNDTVDGYYTPNAYVEVTSDLYVDDSSTYWNKFYLDREEIGVTSFDGQASDFGQYLVYQARPATGENGKLTMAYCHSNCQNINGWARHTLKLIAPLNTSDFQAPAIGVNNVGDVFVSYTQATGGNKLKILKGGRLYRSR